MIPNVVIHVGLRKINTSIPQLSCTLSNNSSSLLCIGQPGGWSTSGGARPPRRKPHKVPPGSARPNPTQLGSFLIYGDCISSLSCTPQVPSISIKRRQSSALLHVPQASTHMDFQESTAGGRPWRKACLPCTRAKRRCDKRLPACQRCVKKDVSCQYPLGHPYARGAVRTPRTTENSEPSPLNSLHHLRAGMTVATGGFGVLIIHGTVVLTSSTPCWSLALP